MLDQAETESVIEQLNGIRLSNEEIVLVSLLYAIYALNKLFGIIWNFILNFSDPSSIQAKNAINKAIDRERLKEEKSNTVIAELPVDKPQDSPLWAKRQAKKKQQAATTTVKATDAK